MTIWIMLNQMNEIKPQNLQWTLHAVGCSTVFMMILIGNSENPAIYWDNPSFLFNHLSLHDCSTKVPKCFSYCSGES